MTRVERWERRSEVPLILLALAFLVAYAWPILDPTLERDIAGFLNLVSWTVWVAFVVDFSVRIVLAEDRRTYALNHWYDLLLIALPMFRPLRLLRVLAFAQVLSRSLTRNLIGRVTVYVIGTSIVAVALGALAVLDAERGANGANILTFGDALWWGATTVTTVGYGDHFPVTGAGRLVAVALMLVGTALLGSITAAVAAWFVKQVQLESESDANS